MAVNRSWQDYRISYRAQEMTLLSTWIRAGHSGAIIGLTGMGKSNLLGFLCHRPDALAQYISDKTNVNILVPIDLNNVPADDLATFYRVILRSFYERRRWLDEPARELVIRLYLENRTTLDPFLSQSALRELLLHCQEQQYQVTLVLDRLDKFLYNAPPRTAETLRGLRDSFKAVLSYVVGLSQELIYLPDPGALGDLYQILDTRMCWVGPMNTEDAQQLIIEETTLENSTPDKESARFLMQMTGSHPALLQSACRWWSQHQQMPRADWFAALSSDPSMRHRLTALWSGLTQEEQQFLTELQYLRQRSESAGRNRSGNDVKKLQANLEMKREVLLNNVVKKGLIRQKATGWHIFSTLFAAFVAEQSGSSRGRLSFNQEMNLVFQGQNPLEELTPLEESVLRFLVKHPHTRHTYTDIIEAAWPEEESRAGVSNEALFTQIKGLRGKIEPIPSQPCYILNWKGTPEGGYRCFPEGRPR